MAASQSRVGEKRSSGFLRYLINTLAVFVASFHTRLELFVTELEEERERLKQTFVLILLVFFGLGLGFILLNVFAVALFWQNGWILAIAALAAIYLGVGVIAAMALRKKILTRPGLFPATLAELRKDCDRLRSSSDG